MDILATDMNRAGFLYFQEKFSSDGFLVNYVTISTLFKVVAARHFAELWVDAEIECRPLIKAIKTARAINISWHTKFPLP